MKPIKLLTLFFTLFTLTVNGFTQTPDRVLSQEEFRQQKIEEKRQQLKREIQVRGNDWMYLYYRWGNSSGYQFQDNNYSFDEHKKAVVDGEQNFLNSIFGAADDVTKTLFFVEAKIIYHSIYRSGTGYSLLRPIAERIVLLFNEFLAASPENREKVAQAIRDYRLAEFVKNELPDIEAERNVSTGNYRFIGFAIGIGVSIGYSDRLNLWSPPSSSDEPIIPFSWEAEFKYAYLYRIGGSHHAGFSIGLSVWSLAIITYLGVKASFCLKLERVVFELGGYFYYKMRYKNTEEFKTIDIGAILSMNYLLGSRMNYLLGLEFRLNLNKLVTATKGIDRDEVGHLSIVLKFGYGF